MTNTTPAPTVIDVDIDGEIIVDLTDRIEVDGDQDPVITWRIPYCHAETLADALESIDLAKQALTSLGDAFTATHDREAQALRAGLKVLEDAGVIFRTDNGWYLKVRTCRVCGCTDVTACTPPCSWAQLDLCSACAVVGVP